MEIVDRCVNALIKPVESLKKEKKKVSLMEGVKIIVIGSFIAGIFAAINTVIVLNSLSAQIGGGINPMVSIGAFIGSLILNPIIGLISALILGGMIFVMAKILGGKGEFGVQFGLMALIMAPVSIISSILNIIPFAGGVLSSLVTLYALYPLTISIKEAYNLDTLKAVVSWLIPIIIIAVVVAIFAAIIAVLVGGAMPTGA